MRSSRAVPDRRCTAGFPSALEPHFVPHHGTRTAVPTTAPRAARCGACGHGRWAGRERSPSSMRVSRDRSRFDRGRLGGRQHPDAGGPPDAIDRRPARRPMRRIMVLVYPHAPTFDPDDENADPADDAGRAPTVTDSLSGCSGHWPRRARSPSSRRSGAPPGGEPAGEAARCRCRVPPVRGPLRAGAAPLVPLPVDADPGRREQPGRPGPAARRVPFLHVVEPPPSGQLTRLDPSGLPLPYVRGVRLARSRRPWGTSRP